MHSHVLACRLAVQSDAAPLEPKSVIRFVRRLPGHGEAGIATQPFRIFPRHGVPSILGVRRTRDRRR